MNGIGDMEGLNDMCFESLDINQGLTESIWNYIVKTLRLMNEKLLKGLCRSGQEDCCRIQIGCFGSLEDVGIQPKQVFVTGVDDSKWIRELIDDRCTKQNQNFFRKYGIQDNFTTRWIDTTGYDCLTVHTEQLSKDVILKKYKYGQKQQIFRIESDSMHDQVSILVKVNDKSALGIGPELLAKNFNESNDVMFYLDHLTFFKKFKSKLQSESKSVNDANNINNDDNERVLAPGGSNQVQEPHENRESDKFKQGFGSHLMNSTKLG